MEFFIYDRINDEFMPIDNEQAIQLIQMSFQKHCENCQKTPEKHSADLDLSNRVDFESAGFNW